jgi:hypothetical protein
MRLVRLVALFAALAATTGCACWCGPFCEVPKCDPCAPNPCDPCAGPMAKPAEAPAPAPAAPKAK